MEAGPGTGTGTARGAVQVGTVPPVVRDRRPRQTPAVGSAWAAAWSMPLSFFCFVLFFYFSWCFAS